VLAVPGSHARHERERRQRQQALRPPAGGP
jgi:hypothetical protein